MLSALVGDVQSFYNLFLLVLAGLGVVHVDNVELVIGFLSSRQTSGVSNIHNLVHYSGLLFGRVVLDILGLTRVGFSNLFNRHL